MRLKMLFKVKIEMREAATGRELVADCLAQGEQVRTPWQACQEAVKQKGLLPEGWEVLSVAATPLDEAKAARQGAACRELLQELGAGGDDVAGLARVLLKKAQASPDDACFLVMLGTFWEKMLAAFCRLSGRLAACGVAEALPKTTPGGSPGQNFLLQ
jgi:hypothetical protein